MTDKTAFTRRELYDLVWETPIAKLAEQLGISDRGLAKICERHRVPTPPRGYWAKVEAGGRPKRAIFAEAAEHQLNLVEINSTLSRIPDEARAVLEKARQERRMSGPKKQEMPRPVRDVEPVIAVHPALVATAKALRKAKISGSNIVSAFGNGCLGVKVGSENVERAIACLDALIRALIAKSFEVQPTDKGAKVGIEPDKVLFALKERTHWQSHVPTKEELLAEKRREEKIARSRSGDSWFSSLYERAYPEKDEIPTGLLVLQIDGYYDGIRRSWADAKSQTLEGLFDKIVVGFEAVVAAERARRLDREELQRNWAEQQRRKELAEKRGKREKQRVDLFKQLMEWDKEAASIQDWISATLLKPPSDNEADLSRMIDWARARCRTLEASTTREYMAERQGQLLALPFLFFQRGID